MTVREWFITWFKAARAPFLVVSFIPAVLGGVIAYRDGGFDWKVFIIVTLGVVMAHSAADFIDDYFDFKTGNLGNKIQQFHDSPLIDGKVTTGQVLVATLLCLAIAGGAGLYLLLEVGYPVVIMTTIGAFIVFFYTSPPIKLNYRGLGETMLFIAFGPMIVFGVYFVLTREFSFEALLASVPLGIFTMNVGMVSNTFDYHDDVASGKRSIPVRIGQAGAVRLIVCANIIAYAAIIIGALSGLVPMWTLLMLTTAPVAVQVVRRTRLYQETSNYTPAMTAAIALSTIAGILLCVAYGIAIILK
jgi:1,4-dihydroxy-2-naphthoate polyprenyltransferase